MSGPGKETFVEKAVSGRSVNRYLVGRLVSALFKENVEVWRDILGFLSKTRKSGFSQDSSGFPTN